MAWSSPMTAVANATFTAAQFNTYVRDNLSATAPALATTAGRHFAVSGTNEIAERAISEDFVSGGTGEATTSTSYTDLTTTGATITMTTGTHALVWFVSRATSGSATTQALSSVAVSGASTVAASDNWCVIHAGTTSTRYGAQHLFTTLTAGANTFTMKFRSSSASATATFFTRALAVMGL